MPREPLCGAHCSLPFPETPTPSLHWGLSLAQKLHWLFSGVALFLARTFSDGCQRFTRPCPASSTPLSPPPPPPVLSRRVLTQCVLSTKVNFPHTLGREAPAHLLNVPTSHQSSGRRLSRGRASTVGRFRLRRITRGTLLGGPRDEEEAPRLPGREPSGVPFRLNLWR